MRAPRRSPAGFEDRLQIQATLQGQDLGQAVTLRGPQITGLRLRLRSYGLRGALSLHITGRGGKGQGDPDPLYAGFLKPGPLILSLRIQAVKQDQDQPAQAQPLEAQAVVLRRSVCEVPLADADPALRDRRYHMTFIDLAARRWRHHHPLRLLVQNSVGAALDAERGLVELEQDWPSLSTPLPFVFLGLPPEGGASFYDLICWYADQGGGVFTYDHRQRRYRLGGAAAPLGAPIAIAASDVAGQHQTLPPIPRHQPVVCNGDTRRASRQQVEAPHAVEGVRHDHLIHSPLPKDESDRVAVEKMRLRVPQARLALRLRRFPLLPFVPGDAVTPPGSGAGQAALRVARVDLQARVLPAQPAGPDAGYRVRMQAECRAAAERPPLPRHRAPAYPLIVEGEVFSEIGAADEETYQSRVDADTALAYYRVRLPLLGEDDQGEIPVPFTPHHLPGQVFLPASKGARARVLLWLSAAQIERFCEFRVGGELAEATQGHQLLLGKRPQSSAAVRLDYQDQKPVFQILRVNDADRGTVRIGEGEMILNLSAAKSG